MAETSQSAERVLDALRRAAGQEISGAAISRALGLSRTAVWKHIETLRASGYAIEAHPRRGYRLQAAPNAPLASEVAPLLHTSRFGRVLHVRTATGSTNRDLSQLADEGAPEGTVVVAETQTAGRGRMARQWFSPPGVNLYFSILLRPDLEPVAVTTLPLLIGCAVAQAVESQADALRVQLKWPNDVLVANRKLCGILCEMQAEADRVHHVVAGIGINVNLTAEALPPDLAATATSLLIATGRPASRAALLAAILNRLEPAYATWCDQGLSPFLEYLHARDILFGRDIAVAQGGRTLQGRAMGIRADGALTLQGAEGAEQLVLSGDAHIGRLKTEG